MIRQRDFDFSVSSKAPGDMGMSFRVVRERSSIIPIIIKRTTMMTKNFAFIDNRPQATNASPKPIP